MRWMFRGILRKLLMLMLIGFVLGNLSTGGIGAITSTIGGVFTTASDALGFDEVVSSVDDALGGKNEKGKRSKATVARRIDGDTLEVALRSGKMADVRLLAFDTPESVRPGVSPECGSHEASNYTKTITEGHAVKLVTDPTQDSVDRYGRLLRYAVIKGRDVGKRVIRAGWGAPYVFDDSNPPQKISVYRDAAAKAKAEGQGVWGMCGGNFHSEADQPWSGD